MIFLLPEGPGLLPVLLAGTGLGSHGSFEGASQGLGRRGVVGARSSPPRRALLVRAVLLAGSQDAPATGLAAHTWCGSMKRAGR